MSGRMMLLSYLERAGMLVAQYKSRNIKDVPGILKDCTAARCSVCLSKPRWREYVKDR